MRYTYTRGDLDSLIVRWGGPSGFTAPRVFRYTWDGLGRRKVVHYPLTGGMDVFSYYDAAGTLRRLWAQHLQYAASRVELVDSLTLSRHAVDPTGRILSQDLWCRATGQPGNPCGNGAQTTDRNAFDRLGQLVFQGRNRNGLAEDIDTLRYDASGNIRWKSNKNGGTNAVVDSFFMAATHNRVDSVRVLGQALVRFDYWDDGSRRTEWRDTSGWNPYAVQSYYYDALGRTSGIVTAQPNPNSPPSILGGLTMCRYDAVGRPVQPCDDSRRLGLDGENIAQVMAWSIASGPALDDPLLAIARGPNLTTRELFYVTDGQGRHLIAVEVDGALGSDIATDPSQGNYAGWTATGAASEMNSYLANRLQSPNVPGLAFYRNRIYDQGSGRWTQEDPLGMAGGLNLYQFNGNNPVAFTDPFGLCPENAPKWLCKAELLARALVTATAGTPANPHGTALNVGTVPKGTAFPVQGVKITLTADTKVGVGSVNGSTDIGAQFQGGVKVGTPKGVPDVTLTEGQVNLSTGNWSTSGHLAGIPLTVRASGNAATGSYEYHAGCIGSTGLCLKSDSGTWIPQAQK